ncbi:MAG TPA: hypothetical protein VGT98_00860, partial [Candidatus Elarobacter sp.]|nr:hypothetical protein [Candidatus Elarobacter sp.]
MLSLRALVALAALEVVAVLSARDSARDAQAPTESRAIVTVSTLGMGEGVSSPPVLQEVHRRTQP